MDWFSVLFCLGLFSSLFEALLHIRNESSYGIAVSSRFGACFQKHRVPVGLCHLRYSVTSTFPVQQSQEPLRNFSVCRVCLGVRICMHLWGMVKDETGFRQSPCDCCSTFSFLMLISFYPHHLSSPDPVNWQRAASGYAWTVWFTLFSRF